MKLVLPLDDAAADLATVGGKGASLARLTRAGLPVPAGFHVTTEAYRAFVVAVPRRDRPGGSRTRRRRCSPGTTSRRRWPRRSRRAYRALGDDVPVAVRSSATAEDLPDAVVRGPAGHLPQHRGDDAVLDAVKRCWASLWTARAIAYRDGHGVAPRRRRAGRRRAGARGRGRRPASCSPPTRSPAHRTRP